MSISNLSDFNEIQELFFIIKFVLLKKTKTKI